MYERGDNLGHVTQMPRTAYARGLHITFGYGPEVSEKKMFEYCERRTDDGRTPDHGYTVSSPMSHWLR